MDLLTLPYDIRHNIYKHLFPPGPQIYIQAQRDRLQAITSEHSKVPTALLRTCRALNAEASGYLYNSYLFNVIGTKRDCLARYKTFLNVVETHARNVVHVDAFSNGSHSSTMCLSIQAGEGRMAFLKSRERGEPKKIQELENEVAVAASSPTEGCGRLGMLVAYSQRHFNDFAVLCVVVAMILAWVISVRSAQSPPARTE